MSQQDKPVMQEIATTGDGRDITRGFVNPLMIAPPSDSVLRARGGSDYAVYSEVLRDDQVIACFGQRQKAVTGKELLIEAGGKDKQSRMAADYMKEQLQNIGWDRTTEMMLFGIHYGFAVSEAMYETDGRFINLSAIKVRDRRRFGFDGSGRLRMKTQQNPTGELMPERKFWSFNIGADHDDEPYGLGLGHWLYWPTFFKRNGLKYWLIFLEKFAQPTVVGKYGPNALPEEKTRLLQALSAIGTDSGVSMPEGMQVEFLEAARSGTADYASLIDKMDAAIAKVILGQTASTQGTPGKLGNDELQGDVRTDLTKADADLICESYNRSIGKWLTGWNFPNAIPPRVYRQVEPEEDSAKRAERDKKVVDMGFKPTLAYIKENYGDGWEEKATPPEPPAQQLPQVKPAEFAAAGENQPAPVQMAEQARAKSEKATSEWINQVKKLADEAESLEQLQDSLMALYPNLSLGQFADAMATATATAKLAGQAEVLDEQGAKNNG